MVKKFLLADLLLILILGLIPFSRVGLGGPIEGVDLPFPLDPLSYFWSSLEAWQNRAKGFFGWDGTLELSGIPYYIIPASLSYIGLQVAVVERIWWIFVYTLSGWSMYFLVCSLRLGRYNRLAGLVAGVFYMYNPVLAGYHLVLGITPVHLVYATAPLVFAVFIQGLQDKNTIKYPILVGLSSITQVVGNIHTTVLSTFPLLLYVLFNITVERRINQTSRLLRFLILSATFSFLFNSWWLLPNLSNLSNLYSQQSARQLEVLHSMRTSEGLNLFDAIRAYQTYDPFNFGSYYNSVIGISISIMTPLTIYLALLLRPRDKWVIFFASSSLLFTIASLGSKPPLGEAYAWLATHLPLGLALMPANPWPFQFILLLTYAPLLGITVSELVYRSRSLTISKIPFGKVVAFFLVTLILINSWPLLTGNAAGQYREFIVPSYYYEAKQWVDGQLGEFRVFLLPSPPQFLYYVKYSWDRSSLHMVDFLPNFLSKPTVQHLPEEEKPQFQFTKLILNSLQRTDRVGELLRLLGVKYVLLRHDMVWPDTFEPIDTVSLGRSLTNQRDLKLVATFGNLQIYENTCFSALIYSANNIVTILGSADSGDALITLADFGLISFKGSALFFLNETDPKASIDILNKSQLVIISQERLDSDISEQIAKSGVRPVYLLDYSPDSLIIRREILVSGLYRLSLKSPGLARLIVDGTMTVDPTFVNNGQVAEYEVYLQGGLHSFTLTTVPFLVTGLLHLRNYDFGELSSSPQNIEVTFHKVDSTRYVVNIDADRPLILVFSEVFNPNWKAFIDGEEQSHHIANFYTNAYYIDRVGRYQVEVSFEPQKLFQLGSILAIALSSISIPYLLFSKIRRMRKAIEGLLR